MRNKHTPTPWQVGSHPGNGAGTAWRTITAEGEFGAMYVGEAIIDDADFIGRACNAHDDLVAALQEMVDETAMHRDNPTLRNARAALAKAQS